MYLKCIISGCGEYKKDNTMIPSTPYQILHLFTLFDNKLEKALHFMKTTSTLEHLL